MGNGLIRCIHHAGRQIGDSLGQQLGNVVTIAGAYRDVVIEVHRSGAIHHAKDLVRVSGKVGIDRHRLAAKRVGNLDGIHPAIARRIAVFHRLLALLQEKDVGNDFGIGVLLECGIRKANRTKQAHVFGQVGAC